MKRYTLTLTQTQKDVLLDVLEVEVNSAASDGETDWADALAEVLEIVLASE